MLYNLYFLQELRNLIMWHLEYEINLLLPFRIITEHETTTQREPGNKNVTQQKQQITATT